MKKVDKDILKEMKKIKQDIDEPYIEKLPISIMKNTGIVKGKKFTQFRISIPKKFSDIIKLNKEDFQAEIILNKNNHSLNINILKK